MLTGGDVKLRQSCCAFVRLCLEKYIKDSFFGNGFKLCTVEGFKDKRGDICAAKKLLNLKTPPEAEAMLEPHLHMHMHSGPGGFSCHWAAPRVWLSLTFPKHCGERAPWKQEEPQSFVAYGWRLSLRQFTPCSMRSWSDCSKCKLLRSSEVMLFNSLLKHGDNLGQERLQICF